MKEILGKNLKKFFDAVDSECNDADITYAGDRYEVWKVSDELFLKMRVMSEEEFVKLAGEDAYWRSCKGSNLDEPDVVFIVNGHKLIGWRDEINFCGVCRSKCGKEIYQEEYKSLLDYLCNCIGASLPKNVCVCAVDLAEYNNMTMGELFEKYE